VKAAVCYESGGPEVLRYEEVPDPTITPSQLLVRVAAISIEGGDTLSRAGGAFATTPHVVGYQCAGVVEAVGESVSGFSVGDEAVTLGLDGSHAELRAAESVACWKLPPGIGLIEAACVPVPYGTAHDCLFEFGRLVAGEVALIHAGAGGVGIGAIQMAKRAGARVLATASSNVRLQRLGDFGLDDGINYTEVDFVEAVRELTGGHGADVIVDSVGGSTLAGSLRALAYRGRCVSVGEAGREAPALLDVSAMRGNNQSLMGYFLGAELILTARPYPLIAGLLEQVARGELRVVIDSTYPLSEAADAHARIESRQAFGRVVLIP
jgi:NADPH2:quinone reductase